MPAKRPGKPFQGGMTGERAHRILGLAGQATAAEVRRAYRRRALEWHPDRFQSDEDKSRHARLFLEARDAYEFLRKEGFPALADEPAPEPRPDIWTYASRFSPTEDETIPPAERPGPRIPWDPESTVLWGVVMPLGATGMILVARWVMGWFGR